MNENGISWDPTMNDHSSHIIEKEDDGDNIKLHQKFEVLQQEWESYIQSIPRTVRRYSTDNSAAMAKAVDQLLDSSPRNLISSLQQKLSPPKGGYWKIRTNNLAAEEMLRERRSVIESGRLKGRRLFQAVEDETEMGLRAGRSSDDDHDQKVYKYGRINGINLVQEISTELVRSVPFYDSDHKHDESGVSNELPGGCFPSSSSSSSSSSSPSHQNVEIQAVEVEKKVQEMRRVANFGGNGNINNGRSWMVFMGWFAFASIIYAVFIAPMRIFGGYGDHEHHEMFLVPT